MDILVVSIVLVWTALFVWQLTLAHRREIERHERYVRFLLGGMKRLEDRIHAASIPDFLALQSGNNHVERIHAHTDEELAELETIRASGYAQVS
jgi:hypothetical protein